MYRSQAVIKNAIDTAKIIPHFEALAAQHPNSGIRFFRHNSSVDLGEEFTVVWMKVRGECSCPFHVRGTDEARALYRDLRSCLRRGLSGRELALTMCRIGARRP